MVYYLSNFIAIVVSNLIFESKAYDQIFYDSLFRRLVDDVFKSNHVTPIDHEDEWYTITI